MIGLGQNVSPWGILGDIQKRSKETYYFVDVHGNISYNKTFIHLKHLLCHILDLFVLTVFCVLLIPCYDVYLIDSW